MLAGFHSTNHSHRSTDCCQHCHHGAPGMLRYHDKTSGTAKHPAISSLFTVAPWAKVWPVVSSLRRGHAHLSYTCHCTGTTASDSLGVTLSNGGLPKRSGLLQMVGIPWSGEAGKGPQEIPKEQLRSVTTQWKYTCYPWFFYFLKVCAKNRPFGGSLGGFTQLQRICKCTDGQMPPSLAWIHRFGRSSRHIMAIRQCFDGPWGKNTTGAMETWQKRVERNPIESYSQCYFWNTSESAQLEMVIFSTAWILHPGEFGSSVEEIAAVFT